MLYGADGFPGRISKLTLDGKLLGVLGRSGRCLKQFGWIHQMACPVEDTLYVAELLNWRIQKLVLQSWPPFLPSFRRGPSPIGRRCNDLPPALGGLVSRAGVGRKELPMRSKIIGVVIGLGLVAGLTGSALACAFHDQQAAAAQQQTAQAQQQVPTSTQ